MEAIGAYEAKTHLPQLLDRVANGETVTITRHGVPVAVLQPTGAAKRQPFSETIEQIKLFRAGNLTGGASIKEMIEEGRK